MSHQHTTNSKKDTILKPFKIDTKGKVCSLWWSYDNLDKCIWKVLSLVPWAHNRSPLTSMAPVTFILDHSSHNFQKYSEKERNWHLLRINHFPVSMPKICQKLCTLHFMLVVGNLYFYYFIYLSLLVVISTDNLLILDKLLLKI